MRKATDTSKEVFTCPHCKIVRFTTTQLAKYIHHVALCTFRPVRCPFADCDVTFIPRVLNFVALTKDKLGSLLEVTVDELRASLEQHYATECTHKVICNLAECKQHVSVVGNDVSVSRILPVHELHTHVSNFIQSLPAVNVNQLNVTQTIWSDCDMRTKFPDDVHQCLNQLEDELIVPPTESNDEEEDASLGEEFRNITRVLIQQVSSN